MTGEVAFGQYLDVRAGRVPDQDDPVRAAMNVIVHKSARYSVVYPLTIGARLGGADAALVRLLAGIGRPLGIAYQLRDDDLGVFGDAEVTGKPLCGDVAEGKRTVLLALTGRCASPADADWLRSRLGGAVTEEDAERIRDIVASSGARSRHEALIAVHQDEARSAWERGPPRPPRGRAGGGALGGNRPPRPAPGRAGESDELRGRRPDVAGGLRARCEARVRTARTG
jgi:polyprenyl synthetase